MELHIINTSERTMLSPNELCLSRNVSGPESIFFCRSLLRLVNISMSLLCLTMALSDATGDEGWCLLDSGVGGSFSAHETHIRTLSK